MSNAIDFYCGLNHRTWNHHRADPGSLACISPIVGHGNGQFQPTPVHVPPETKVLQDSGAYGEPLSRFNKRLTFANALKRQEAHADRYGYADKVAYRASYDLLIDHRLANRQIVRADDIAGVEAVDYTVRAARFLSKHRNGYALALNAQGSTPEQYFGCVQQIVPLLQDVDILGMGGWCIIGRCPSLMADFLETLALVIPFIAQEGVKMVHLYGCIFFPALSACLAICDHYNIKMSVDSAFPSFAPRIGKWGYGSWRRRNYRRPPVLESCKTESCPPDSRCLGMECIRHIKLTREWLSCFRNREYDRYNYYARNIDQYCLGQVLDLNLEEV
jgi:hypothetical protein